MVLAYQSDSITSRCSQACAAAWLGQVLPHSWQCHCSVRGGSTSVTATALRGRHLAAYDQPGDDGAECGHDTEDRGLLVIGHRDSEGDQECQDGGNSSRDGADGDSRFLFHFSSPSMVRFTSASSAPSASSTALCAPSCAALLMRSEERRVGRG